MRFTMDYEEYITLSSENEDNDDDEVQFVGKFHRGPYIVDLEDEDHPRRQKQSSKEEKPSNHQQPCNLEQPSRSQEPEKPEQSSRLIETNGFGEFNGSDKSPSQPKPTTPDEPEKPTDSSRSQDSSKSQEPSRPQEPSQPPETSRQGEPIGQQGPRIQLEPCDQQESYNQQEPCKEQESSKQQELGTPQESTKPEELTKPAKRFPSDRELMIAKKELGNKKFRCNSFSDAIRCYREAIELSKKINDDEMTAILHFNLAMSYDKLGSYAQAADECAEAVKINDQYLKAHVKRAEIYMARGKYEEAVICYEHICEIDSTKRHDALQRIAKAKALAAQLRKPDQYEILGLRPHFTAEQLRAAYKQKARAHHPDRHSNADIVTRRIHERIFKEASEANTYFRKRFNYH